MRAGKLRHKLELQRNSPSRNAVGEEVADWRTIEVFWGAIIPLSGRELLNAQQGAAEMSHRIERRYVSGITATDRVKFGSRTFDINAVINVDERDRELHLMCMEAV